MPAFTGHGIGSYFHGPPGDQLQILSPLLRAQFLRQEKLEFKHLCDDWREGFNWQEAFDFSLSYGSKIGHFHFSSCRFSFLFLCFVAFTSVLDKDSVELKVLAIE